MNFTFTLLSVIGSFIILGGVAIFVMNLASTIMYRFMDRKLTFSPRYVLCLFILTLAHVYIYLSLASFIILLVYGSTADNIVLKTILWIVATLCVIIPAWMAQFQAKNKLKDAGVRPYEPVHNVALQFNSLISTIAFPILAFFPSLITSGWSWVESITQKFL